jgi:hypothetical protein
MTREKNLELIARLNEQQRDEFLLWFLTDPTHGVLQYTNDIPYSVGRIISLFKRKLADKNASKEEWEKASDAAAGYVIAAYAATAQKKQAYSTQYEKLLELLGESK